LVTGDLLIDGRASTDFDAFAYPQMLVKQSWQKATGRFGARLVESSEGKGLLCNQSFITVNGPNAVLEAACLAYNSLLAVYFLQLTSGRIAAYRPEAQVSDLLMVPIPKSTKGLSKGIHSLEDIDRRVYDAFELKDAERVLVEDMIAYTLADFRGDAESRGRRLTTGPATDQKDEALLAAYCDHFIRVLAAGFGADRRVTARIFHQVSGKRLPYRLVAFELGGRDQGIKVESIESGALLQQLERLDYNNQANGIRRGIYHERVTRIYDNRGGAPTIYILKPDRARYWTRSQGLYDADEVALDIFQWLQRSRQKKAAVG
jgi:hypothetical protein